jgi:hypothetical protein
MTTESKTIRTAYKYRAYCDRDTRQKALKWMTDLAGVWNAALDERQTSYEEFKQNPEIKPVDHKFAQYHHVSRQRHPELSHINIITLQAVLAKLHDSYKSFFALTKKDDTARPPRSKYVYRILEFGRISDNPFGWILNGHVLSIKGIGKYRWPGLLVSFAPQDPIEHSHAHPADHRPDHSHQF